MELNVDIFKLDFFFKKKSSSKSYFLEQKPLSPKFSPYDTTLFLSTFPRSMYHSYQTCEITNSPVFAPCISWWSHSTHCLPFVCAITFSLPILNSPRDTPNWYSRHLLRKLCSLNRHWQLAKSVRQDTFEPFHHSYGSHQQITISAKIPRLWKYF